MTQLDLINPRETATVTRAMTSDPHLRGAIKFVRTDHRPPFRWPVVEPLVEVEGRMTWAVDDRGMQYVVVGPNVFPLDDFRILDEKVRRAAKAFFRRMDAVA
jgi:hypothetical protein